MTHDTTRHDTRRRRGQAYGVLLVDDLVLEDGVDVVEEELHAGAGGLDLTGGVRDGLAHVLREPANTSRATLIDVVCVWPHSRTGAGGRSPAGALLDVGVVVDQLEELLQRRDALLEVLGATPLLLRLLLMVVGG
jgi:hypothetical protein